MPVHFIGDAFIEGASYRLDNGDFAWVLVHAAIAGLFVELVDHLLALNKPMLHRHRERRGACGQRF